MCADTRQAMISRCSADALLAPCVRRSISDKPSAGRAEIYSGAGQAPDRSFALSSLNANVRASCTGPDVGVRSLLPCVPGAMRNCQRQQTLYARNGHACNLLTAFALNAPIIPRVQTFKFSLTIRRHGRAVIRHHYMTSSPQLQARGQGIPSPTATR